MHLSLPVCVCVCVYVCVSNSDMFWHQLVMVSKIWANARNALPTISKSFLKSPREGNNEGRGTTTIFVRLLVDVRAEIWYFLHSKHRLTSSWRESCSAARQRHRDMKEVEGDWKVRVLYLRCGCKLPGPLTGWVPKTSDRWPAVPESLDRWQLGLWVAQMWAAWLKWFPWRRGTLAQGSVKLLLGKRRWCHYQGDITADFAGQTAEHMFSHV